MRFTHSHTQMSNAKKKCEFEKVLMANVRLTIIIITTAAMNLIWNEYKQSLDQNVYENFADAVKYDVFTQYL